MAKNKCRIGMNNRRLRAKRSAAIRMARQSQQSIGPYSQDATIIGSMITKNQEKLYLSEGKLKYFRFSKNITNVDPVPDIKTEIIDPFEESQELILPDYPQEVCGIEPMQVVETEILESSETNQISLSNIKVENTQQIDTFANELSKTEKLSKSNTNYEIEDSETFKYKLTECFVLLYDCLIPENLAKFKYLKINRVVSDTSPTVESMPLSASPFFCHIPGTYEKLAPSKNAKRMIVRRSREQMISCQKGKKMIRMSRIRPNGIKRFRSDNSKPICNCFKASEDEKPNMRNELPVSNSDSTQQLCSCVASEITMKPIEMEISLFNPDFGKVACGLNKMDFNFLST